MATKRKFKEWKIEGELQEQPNFERQLIKEWKEGLDSA
jgi:hypothetical protein